MGRLVAEMQCVVYCRTGVGGDFLWRLLWWAPPSGSTHFTWQGSTFHWISVRFSIFLFSLFFVLFFNFIFQQDRAAIRKCGVLLWKVYFSIYCSCSYAYFLTTYIFRAAQEMCKNRIFRIFNIYLRKLLTHFFLTIFSSAKFWRPSGFSQ